MQEGKNQTQPSPQATTKKNWISHNLTKMVLEIAMPYQTQK